MNRRALRRVAYAGALAGTVPSLLLLATVRATAATPTYALYSMTAVVRATSTGGDIGATGGLTPLDSGSASVDAALDSSPTAMVLARPIEPGTSYATLIAQVPAGAPIPPIPEADVAYPGPTAKQSVAPAPTTTASGAVTQSSATGQASTAGSTSGVATVGATTASSTLTSSGDGHAVTAVADAYVSGFSVAGVLDVSGVRGHAEISATAGGARTSTATLTIGSITVAGQQVAVDDSGVHAVGQTLPLGPTLAQLTATVNSTLKAAGVSLSLAQPIHTVGTTALGSSASADSGGLSVTVTTPDETSTLPGGASSAVVATVTLGRVRLTEADQPTIDSGTPLTGTVGTTVPGSPAIPGTPAVPAVPGQVVTVGGGTTTTTPGRSAAPAAQTLRIAGRRISTRAAIAALGGWQAITLGLATFAVLALRNRPEDEEELLCPCPT